jgi:hypothetical protein
MPFTTEKCNDLNTTVINTYKVGAFTNGIENFFPSKLKNLRNCTLKIGISQNRPYVIMQHITNENFNLVGREVKIVEELSKSLNFQTSSLPTIH